MKKAFVLIAVSLSIIVLGQSCAKQKPACGNTKKVVKKKTKELKQNKHFNM